MKRFACGDVVPGCAAVFVERDQEAVLAAVAVHARHDHGLAEVPPHLAESVRRATVDA